MSEEEERESEKQKRLVWFLCFYLCFAYLVFGVICYLAWQRSSIFGAIGWSWNQPNAEIFQTITYSLCGGGFGAISYGLWSIFQHYCVSKNFKPAFAIWYVFSPVNGSILGVATYAVVVGGLLVLGESVTLRSNWAIFALAFLAGFGSKRVLRRLNALAKQIFQEDQEIPETSV